MSYSWFAPPSPEITSDGISVEMSDTGRYVVHLGSRHDDPNPARLYLAPEIARALIESMHEALAAQGETVDLPRPDAEQTALDQLDELTREVEFMHPLTGHGPRLRAILAHLGHVAAASESSDEDEDYDAVAVISDERLAELREQLAADKRAAWAGDAL